jgi:hypothetical protein
MALDYFFMTSQHLLNDFDCTNFACNIESSKYLQTADSNSLAVGYNPFNSCLLINKQLINQIKYFFYSNNIETSKGRRATDNPIWTISVLYFPIVGYYDRVKFHADYFSRSGGVRVGKKPECSIGAPLAPLNKLN